MNKYLSLLIGITLLASNCIYGQLPDPLTGQNNFRNYSIEEGLPQSNVYTILQDQRGYLWIGTDGGGLSQFDGRSFKSYNKNNGLAGNTVRKIYEDSRGWLWIGTDGGISIYDGHRFRTIDKKDSLSGSTILSFFEDQHHRIWAGSDDGGVNIISYYPKKDSFGIQTITDKEGLRSSTIFDIYQDKAGRVWLATLYGGVHILTPTEDESSPYRIDVLHKGIDIPSGNILCIEPDSADNLWFGTYDMGIFKIEHNPNDQKRKVITYDELSSGSVWDILITNDSTAWIATGKKGLIKFQDNHFTSFNESNGLPTNQTTALIKDREGYLWIGTNGDGLCQFIGPHFSHFTVDDGLPSDNVQAIQQDSTGNYWLATDGGGLTLLQFDQKGHPVTKVFTEVEGMVSNYLTDLSIGNPNNENIWLATTKNGIIKFDGTTFMHFTEMDGLKDNRVNSILIDSKGIVWCGTAGGISRFDGVKFLNASMGDLKMKQDGVKAIIEDQNQTIWFATAGGIAQYKGTGMLTTYDQEEGLMHVDANTLAEGPDGDIWIGTNGGGLYRFHKNSSDSLPIQLVADDSLLSSNAINSLIFYDKRTLIVGTDKGFDRVVFDQNGAPQEVRNYNATDGFWGIECNDNAICRDANGNIWLGTVKGVTMYNPRQEKKHVPPPSTNIIDIDLFFKDVDWPSKSDSTIPWFGLPQAPELSYQDNHLTFHFTGISLTNPQKVHYQYKLEGWDNDWSPASQENKITYSGLTPGDYTFKVKASNAAGDWNQTATNFSFTIHPPWYQTWWFYGLCLLFILTGIYGFIKLRERRLKKEKQVLETKVQERTKEVVQKKEEIEKQKTVIEEKNKDIMDSINYASRIQNAILPREEKREQLIQDSFILFRPKDVVSGDFYWMEEKDDKILFTAADCTGHGVPGAFMSMMSAALLNEAVNEKGLTQPNAIFDEVRKGIIHALKQTGEEGESQDGMDAALCMLDKKNGHLAFSGANNPLYLIREKGIPVQNGKKSNYEPNLSNETYNLFEIPADAQPIGYYPGKDKPFTKHKFTIRPGDTIYVFSDGYPDQFGGPKGKKFMYKRFKKLLLNIQEKDMKAQLEHLEDTLEEWMNDPGPYGEPPEQIDDILVIGVRF